MRAPGLGRAPFGQWAGWAGEWDDAPRGVTNASDRASDVLPILNPPVGRSVNVSPLGWSIRMGLDILLVVACALIDADGRVLLAKRPLGGRSRDSGSFRAAKSSRARHPMRPSSVSSKRSSDQGHAKVPRAVYLCQPQLRGVPSADASLLVSQVGGDGEGATGTGACLGSREATW